MCKVKKMIETWKKEESWPRCKTALFKPRNSRKSVFGEFKKRNIEVVMYEYISAFEYLRRREEVLSDDYATELIVLSKTKTATGFHVTAR